MLLSDRLNLRDNLFIELKNKKCIHKSKNDSLAIYKHELLYVLQNNININILYNAYVQEFRSKDEALYCLRHQDDISNHLCSICGKPNMFYNKKHGYRNTCGNKECNKKIHQSEEVRNKREQTCIDRYGASNPGSVKAFQIKAEITKFLRYGDPHYTNPEKRKNTCLDRYNNPYYTNYEQAKQTCLDRYGKDNPFKVKEFQEKAKDTKERLYNDPNYNNREKAKETNNGKYGVDWYPQTEEFLQKCIDTNMANRNVPYPTQDPTVQALAKESNMRVRDVPYPMMNTKVVETWRKNYQEKHGIKDPIITEECQPILDQIEKGLQLIDTYSNDNYFEQFIKFLYIYKNRLLKINEIMNIFNKAQSTIDNRIHKLHLEKYFDIQESKLELQVRDFLISNNYFEKDHFRRHLFNLTIDKDHRQQLDFLFEDYKIAFEVNDVDGHNTNEKDSNYHINKTKMAREQHDTRLIHLWEWELNSTNWFKTSQWILHLLNQNKIQLDIKNCIIKEVSKEDQISFLNQYSLDSDKNFTNCLGIYYNNELIEIILFKDNIISICVKFGYELINGTKEFIKNYMQNNNISYMLIYVDLSKFTGKTFEDMGFELVTYIEPFIISEAFNESSTYKQFYNCGYNIYIINL